MGVGPTRQDTYSISVQLRHPQSGVMQNLGVWDKMSGGELDSDETQYYPGGMAPPVSLGGRKTVGNVTVSRLYRLQRDHDRIQMIVDSVGKSDMVISKQPLDVDGNIYGRPLVYRGTLKRCTPPEVDSESSGAGMLELEMTVDGFPSS